MNQTEIKKIIESERDGATSKTVWSTILNKFKKLKGEQLKIALAGIERSRSTLYLFSPKTEISSFRIFTELVGLMLVWMMKI